jgi:hypothetical protein
MDIIKVIVDGIVAVINALINVVIVIIVAIRDVIINFFNALGNLF